MNKKSAAAIERLRQFPTVIDAFKTDKRSAVLVPLVANPTTGDLEVILTVRSSNLRTNAGDVAFPGGKRDPEDVDLIATAKREALEEIGLPYSASEHLTTLSPVLSRHLQVVTPIVAFCPHLTPQDIVTQLRPNPGEVAAIFSTPLESFLDPPEGTYAYFDMQWLSSLSHRVHRFDRCGTEHYIVEQLSLSEDHGQKASSLTSVQMDFGQAYHQHVSLEEKGGHQQRQREPETRNAGTVTQGWSVYGLTAGVVIEVAKIAYGRQPSFDEYAPNQEQDVGLMAEWHNQRFSHNRL
ncbi:hypothetical protein BGZ94_001737 [Podila epigama]|nr:hypothetical protein BGZ94_001737 [Podila epigama]